MKALSIKQPWAGLIVQGFKDIENRTWRTHYRGPVLIHAGKSGSLMDADAAFNLVSDRNCSVGVGWMMTSEGSDRHSEEWLNLDLCGGFGGIIGIAEIVDCVESSASPWFVGPFGFVLANARPLPFRQLRGALGFFEGGQP